MQLQDESISVDAIISGDLDQSGLPENEVALLKLCEKVTLHAYRTSPEDIESLRNHGWTDGEIAEAILVTGMFAMFNRVADAFGLIDPQYREMHADGENAIRPADKFEDG